MRVAFTSSARVKRVRFASKQVNRGRSLYRTNPSAVVVFVASLLLRAVHVIGGSLSGVLDLLNNLNSNAKMGER